MNVVFDHAEDVAAGTRTLWFRPERRVRYVAGQFTELYLPHEHVDERGPRRWFTLSSSPTEELVAITTKFAADRGSSFKQKLAALQPGAPLKLADPMGDFVLPKDPAIPLTFIAAGLGITPVRSMVKWLHDQNERRAVRLIYATSRADELAFLPLFQEYNLELTTLPKEGAGQLGTEQVLAWAQDNDGLVYLSGPEIMTETFFKYLTAQGVAKERLVTDYFPGYALI